MLEALTLEFHHVFPLLCVCGSLNEILKVKWKSAALLLRMVAKTSPSCTAHWSCFRQQKLQNFKNLTGSCRAKNRACLKDVCKTSCAWKKQPLDAPVTCHVLLMSNLPFDISFPWAFFLWASLSSGISYAFDMSSSWHRFPPESPAGIFFLASTLLEARAPFGADLFFFGTN